MSKTYRGGIPFKRKYDSPENCTEVQPERIVLSLKSGRVCLFREGDTVKKYECISSSDGGFPAVFSGIGGRIEKISAIGGGTEVTVRLDRSAAKAEPLSPPLKKLADMEYGEMASLLLSRGIAPVKRGKRDAKGLIVDCTSSPYNDSRLYLCRAFPDKIIGGAKILMKLVGARSCVFAIPNSDLVAAQYIESLLPERSDMLKIVLTKDKLPASVPHLTVSAVFGVEVNAAKDIVDAGYPVVSPLTCLACYRALAEGIPFCEGYLSVNDSEGNLTVSHLPFGTELRSLLTVGEGKAAVRAEELYGSSAEGAVMSEHTEALIITNNTAHTPSEGVCIGCRRCISICPSQLAPIDLYNAINRGNDEASISLYASCCFECGDCSYICPSSLPLAETIIAFKRDGGIISAEVADERSEVSDRAESAETSAETCELSDEPTENGLEADNKESFELENTSESSAPFELRESGEEETDILNDGTVGLILDSAEKEGEEE